MHYQPPTNLYDNQTAVVLQEEFNVPYSKEEVIGRADALLQAYGYTSSRTVAGVVYRRGMAAGSLFGFRPRQYASEFNIWPVSSQSVTNVGVNFKLTTYGYPMSYVTRLLFRDEFEDLIRYLQTGAAPEFDREQQSNKSSWLVNGSMLAIMPILAAIGVAHMDGILDLDPGAFAVRIASMALGMLLVVFMMSGVLYFLPVKLKPKTLEARLVPDLQRAGTSPVILDLAGRRGAK